MASFRVLFLQLSVSQLPPARPRPSQLSPARPSLQSLFLSSPAWPAHRPESCIPRAPASPWPSSVCACDSDFTGLEFLRIPSGLSQVLLWHILWGKVFTKQMNTDNKITRMFGLIKGIICPDAILALGPGSSPWADGVPGPRVMPVPLLSPLPETFPHHPQSWPHAGSLLGASGHLGTCDFFPCLL